MHPIFQKTEKKIYTAVPQFFFFFFEIEILWYKFDQKLTGFLGLSLLIQDFALKINDTKNKMNMSKSSF